jgi:probable rRNA maturation factor
VTTVDVTGRAVPHLSRRDITSFVRKVLLEIEKAGGKAREIAEVSIALVDDTAMKALNRKFRGKNKTTDVLTFPSEDAYLGDIIISVEQARRQASEQRHSLSTETRYLILHGILHALGYDHETDEGEMNELELRVRAAVGLE